MSDSTTPAWADFVARHDAALHRFARHLGVGSADDQVSQTWDRVLARRHDLPTLAPKDARRILFTVLRNGAIDVLRRAQSRRDLEADSARDRTELVAKQGPANPAVQAARDERARLVASAYRKLGAADRELVDAYYYQGLSTAQIAERDGVSDRTVRRRLKAIRTLMKSDLRDEGLSSNQLSA
ncbi:MAG: sigma-70 family RNA polymerase sigma factor [Planctomycetota bacterium]